MRSIIGRKKTIEFPGQNPVCAKPDQLGHSVYNYLDIFTNWSRCCVWAVIPFASFRLWIFKHQRSWSAKTLYLTNKIRKCHLVINTLLQIFHEMLEIGICTSAWWSPFLICVCMKCLVSNWKTSACSDGLSQIHFNSQFSCFQKSLMLLWISIVQTRNTSLRLLLLALFGNGFVK